MRSKLTTNNNQKIFHSFRLQPVRVNVDGMGVPEEDGIYKDGLLGIIARNETIVIPRVDTFVDRLMALDFTVPFGINKYINLIYQFLNFSFFFCFFNSLL